MNGADYLILGVLAFSMLLGMWRGFIRESIALIAWLGGMWLAWRYSPVVEPLLEGMSGDGQVRTWAARAIILLCAIIAGWMLAALLSYFLRHSSLSIMVDRLLGVLFGGLRGAVVVAIFVVLGEAVELDRAEWWKNSRLLPYAGEGASWIRAFAETGMKMFEPTALSGRGS
jgi:membrane protein required for colicin V production